MYYNHLLVKLTFCALLTLGACANAMLLYWTGGLVNHAQILIGVVKCTM